MKAIDYTLQQASEKEWSNSNKQDLLTCLLGYIELQDDYIDHVKKDDLGIFLDTLHKEHQLLTELTGKSYMELIEMSQRKEK